MKIIILGTAYPYRGGIASFNERLAFELKEQGHEVQIFTFTLQYPGFLFPGKTQFSDDPPPNNLRITRILNSVNPITWIKTGLKIRNENPDLIISKFWIPIMGPALGTSILIGKNNATSVSIIDNIIPHEHRIGDKLFSKYFTMTIDKFIVMSSSVREDMKNFTKTKPVILAPHPIYDNYGEITDRKDSCTHIGLDPEFKYLMFFGFIRDYKGLDILLEAINDDFFRKNKIKCLVAGEYYGNEQYYNDLIEKLKIEDLIIKRTDFIPNEEVKYYFSVVDVIVQPYKSATQSGISQMAYHFETPMIVTNVGGLSEIIKDQKDGFVVPPDPLSIRNAIKVFFSNPEKVEIFKTNLRNKKQEFSWKNFVHKIIG